MYDAAEILSRTKSVIATQTGYEYAELSGKTNLYTGLHMTLADVSGTVDLLNTEFGTGIKPIDAVGAKTIDDFCALVAARA